MLNRKGMITAYILEVAVCYRCLLTKLYVLLNLYATGTDIQVAEQKDIF